MVLKTFNDLKQVTVTPLDLLPYSEIREKIVDLVLQGCPAAVQGSQRSVLEKFRTDLMNTTVKNAKVVVFGGGTGLSNIIGGDSRQQTWVKKPFCGLKELFPSLRSVVCITDDGGSTGELLKDLPLIAIGDIRHVLLSSIQIANLQKKNQIDEGGAQKIAELLFELFNWRYQGVLTPSNQELLHFRNRISVLPNNLQGYLQHLIDYLFEDRRLENSIKRDNCFGNLLVAAAIYREVVPGLSNYQLYEEKRSLHNAIIKGLNSLGRVVGAGENAVLPCSSTPAQLKVLYTNGVEIYGEHKLSDSKRGFPVDSIQVDYSGEVRVYEEVTQYIEEADIIILAPGSLYSSIIPVFKVPGLADLVRKNQKALKVLISNLWVQTGETDLSIADPERKFHVSDMIEAYEKNIPGGTRELFNEVLCVSLKDIPASILQSYAVEGKVPIYLDREDIVSKGFHPVECDIYSKLALRNRGVIQHDPDGLAAAIKALYVARTCFEDVEGDKSEETGSSDKHSEAQKTICTAPFIKYRGIQKKLQSIKIDYIGEKKQIDTLLYKSNIGQILWNHPVIPLCHLDYFDRIVCVEEENWDRDQRWDNVFSFFDPEDQSIKIRADQLLEESKLEVALMIAIGESLLGDYADKKVMQEVWVDGEQVGNIYHLHIKEETEMCCFLNSEQLHNFLTFARMSKTENKCHYTRLVNKGEGFTPPGLLMGLMYAWYVDNRLASHIEYKMSLMKIDQSDLIPEQIKLSGKRKRFIEFFRSVIFRCT